MRLSFHIFTEIAKLNTHEMFFNHQIAKLNTLKMYIFSNCAVFLKHFLFPPRLYTVTKTSTDFYYLII